jgi:hypothetical protein
MGSAPACGAASARYSGRMPTLQRLRAGCGPAGKASVAATCSAAIHLPGRKFMPGEPMKWPDEGVRRPLEQRIGRAHLHRRPRVITTTWSAKVSASTWSCVT